MNKDTLHTKITNIIAEESRVSKPMVDKIIEEVAALIDEVIGRDSMCLHCESPAEYYHDDYFEGAIKSCDLNEIKKEQRQRAKQLLSKTKGKNEQL